MQQKAFQTMLVVHQACPSLTTQNRLYSDRVQGSFEGIWVGYRVGTSGVERFYYVFCEEIKKREFKIFLAIVIILE